MYARKGRKRTSAGRQATDALLKALAERNPSLGEHLDDVTGLCEAVGRELGLPEEEMTPLLQAAALHDVGKVAIPDAILDKPGPLDETEWEFMRTHTLIGERILAEAPALAEAAKIVRSSHERHDGNGLPGRPRRRRDPARRADHRRLRLVRRDDLEPPVPHRHERGGRPLGAPQVRRHAVRPERSMAAFVKVVRAPHSADSRC